MKNMHLFLSAEGSHPNSIQLLEQQIGGFPGKSIAYIPTAANGEIAYGTWQTETDTWQLVQTLGADVQPVVLEDYKNSTVIKALRGKDIIWFAGGVCGYLMYWIRRCELDKHLPELLADGSLYVGSSAGSMICAPTLALGESGFADSEHGASVIPGLGLVDFEILPHYTDDMFEPVKRYYQGNKLYLLKNGEVITVDDGRVTVHGTERILTKESRHD